MICVPQQPQYKMYHDCLSCNGYKLYFTPIFYFPVDYLAAVKGCKLRIEDSAYETESEFGRGKRRKKKRTDYEGDSDDEPCNNKLARVIPKSATKVLPPPPLIWSTGKFA